MFSFCFREALTSSSRRVASPSWRPPLRTTQTITIKTRLPKRYHNISSSVEIRPLLIILLSKTSNITHIYKTDYIKIFGVPLLLLFKIRGKILNAASLLILCNNINFCLSLSLYSHFIFIAWPTLSSNGLNTKLTNY